MKLILPRFEGALDEPIVNLNQCDLRNESVGRLLVVDDEPIVRMSIVEALREAGYEVAEADDGTSALHAIRSGGQFDLLITDVGLPGALNGRQVSDAAREADPDLRVLFVTGFAEASVLKGGFLTPTTAVTTKPFDIQGLRQGGGNDSKALLRMTRRYAAQLIRWNEGRSAVDQSLHRLWLVNTALTEPCNPCMASLPAAQDGV